MLKHIILDSKNVDITETDKPFMVSLGTSHTFGQCDHDVPLYYAEGRWNQRVAEHLGLHLISVGLPGITNLGLRLAFLELLNAGLFDHPNCKYVVIEPRSYDTQTFIPLELGMLPENPNSPRGPKQTSIVRFNRKMQDLDFWKSLPASYLHRKLPKENYIMNAVSHLSTVKRHPEKEMAAIAKRNKNYVEQDITREIQVYQEKVVNDYETMAGIIETYTLLEMMIRLIPSKSNWWCFTHLSPNNMTLMEAKFPILYKKLLAHTVGDLMPDTSYFCPCQHLNDKGHAKLFDIIKEKVEMEYYD